MNQKFCGIENQNATDDNMDEIELIRGIKDDVDMNKLVGGIEVVNNETLNQEKEVECKDVENEHMDASQQSSKEVALYMHNKLKLKH